MTQERKDGEERRSARRYAVEIDVEWEGKVGRQKGTVSDISTLGCFVLCSGEVDNGESVSIFIPLGEGMKVQLQGDVVNHVFEIGFGVRFVDLNSAQSEFLETLIGSIDK